MSQYTLPIPFLKGRIFTLLALLFAVFMGLALAAQAKEQPWPMTNSASDVPESMVWGELENGVRYAILPLPRADQSASLRLIVDAGVAEEPKDLPGVSRFVANLAYRGTENLSKDDIFLFHYANGMSTIDAEQVDVGLQETVYALDFHLLGEEQLAKGIDFLSEVAGKRRFDAQEVDWEKALLRRTLVDRNGGEPEWELGERVLYQGSPYAEIDEAELLAAVEKTTADDVKKYWEDYYGADRLTLLIIGDVQKETVETLVKDAFGGLGKAGAKRSELANRKLRNEGGINVLRHTAMTTRLRAYASMGTVDLYDSSVEKRLMAGHLLGLYLDAIVDEDGLFNDGRMLRYGGQNLVGVSMDVSVPQLQERISKVDQAFARIQETGIIAEQFNRLKDEAWKRYQRMAASRELRSSPSVVANEFVKRYRAGSPFQFGEPYEERLQGLFKEMTLDYVNGVGAELFKQKRLSYVITLPETFKLKEKQIEKQFKLMRKGYAFNWNPFAMLDVKWQVKNSYGGEGGMVLSTKRRDIGSYYDLQYAFQNSFRMNLMQTDNALDRFQAVLSIGNGLSDFDTQVPGMATFLRSVLLRTTVAGEGSPQLKETLQAKGLRWADVEVNQGQLAWIVEGDNQEDFSTFLGLMTEWLVLGNLPEKAFDDAKKSFALLARPEDRLSPPDRLDLLQMKDEPRLRRSFSREDLDLIEYETVRSWLEDALRNGYIELTVVGSLSPRPALLSARKTLGAMPKREGRVVQPRHSGEARLGDPGIREETLDRFGGLALSSFFWTYPVDRECDLEFVSTGMDTLFSYYARSRLRENQGLANTSLILSIGDAMVPGSQGILCNLTFDASKREEVEAYVRSLAVDFPEWLTEERARAANRSVLAKIAIGEHSNTALRSFLDQTQGRLKKLECFESFEGQAERMDVRAYRSLAKMLFKDSNFYGSIIMPE